MVMMVVVYEELVMSRGYTPKPPLLSISMPAFSKKADHRSFEQFLARHGRYFCY